MQGRRGLPLALPTSSSSDGRESEFLRIPTECQRPVSALLPCSGQGILRLQAGESCSPWVLGAGSVISIACDLKVPPKGDVPAFRVWCSRAGRMGEKMVPPHATKNRSGTGPRRWEQGEDTAPVPAMGICHRALSWRNPWEMDSPSHPCPGCLRNPPRAAEVFQHLPDIGENGKWRSLFSH